MSIMTEARQPSREEQRAYAKALIEEVVRDFPARRPASEAERGAQSRFAREFEALGLGTSMHPFRFNENLYANLALHFGVASLGTLVGGVLPKTALALHGLAAGSYYADSTRKAYILRRAFPFKNSQNLLAIAPAEAGQPKLRIVFAAHADAAFTGLIFSDFFVKNFAKEPPKALSFLKRSMEFTTKTTASLTAFDALRSVVGPLAAPLRPVEYALTAPAFLAFLLNAQVVMQNEIVPGANDNLTGILGELLLARRLLAHKPKDVEFVFAVTGCEEASLGGADALAREMEKRWSRENTVVIGLDTLSNGELRYLNVEGEISRLPIAPWLDEELGAVSASEARFNGVTGFEIPVGGTDVTAFLLRGYDGVCLTAVDPAIGAARHYHQASDTPENLDYDAFIEAVDYAEALTKAVIKRRLPELGGHV